MHLIKEFLFTASKSWLENNINLKMFVYLKSGSAFSCKATKNNSFIRDFLFTALKSWLRNKNNLEKFVYLKSGSALS